MRFDLWNRESLDAARLRDVVYYFQPGFLPSAHELERVPVQHGSLVRAQDWCGFGASGSRSLASRTRAQNGKRLAAYGDYAPIENRHRPKERFSGLTVAIIPKRAECPHWSESIKCDRIGFGHILGDPKKLNIEIYHLALQQTNKLVHKETFYCDDRNKMLLSQYGQS